jgi:hypothetical protein
VEVKEANEEEKVKEKQLAAEYEAGFAPLLPVIPQLGL